ncbi:hypothetical protein B0I37DRAFT_25493 [Chaetomium sp. MPI-CAGE-AT-0009]|nr:hypothetical protein B0I37DRAFT_25493 [Chaetomium sp. MPI-CAGE-AT-0009]
MPTRREGNLSFRRQSLPIPSTSLKLTSGVTTTYTVPTPPSPLQHQMNPRNHPCCGKGWCGDANGCNAAAQAAAKTPRKVPRMKGSWEQVRWQVDSTEPKKEKEKEGKSKHEQVEDTVSAEICGCLAHGVPSGQTDDDLQTPRATGTPNTAVRRQPLHVAAARAIRVKLDFSTCAPKCCDVKEGDKKRGTSRGKLDGRDEASNPQHRLKQQPPSFINRTLLSPGRTPLSWCVLVVYMPHTSTLHNSGPCPFPRLNLTPRMQHARSSTTSEGDQPLRRPALFMRPPANPPRQGEAVWLYITTPSYRCRRLQSVTCTMHVAVLKEVIS